MNPLDSNQIALLRRTHAQILRGAAAFGVGFHCHLFTQDPALRCLFPVDIETQTRKLMDLIQALLDRLDQPESLAELCRELGHRHRACGTEEAHYDQVGIALLCTLRDALGTGYTEVVEEAWAGAYGELAEAIIGSVQSLCGDHEAD